MLHPQPFARHPINPSTCARGTRAAPPPFLVTEGETEAEAKTSHLQLQGQPVLEQNERCKPCSHGLDFVGGKRPLAGTGALSAPEEGHSSCMGWFLPGTLFEGTQLHQEGRSML